MPQNCLGWKMASKSRCVSLMTGLRRPALLPKSKRGICLSGENGIAAGQERTVGYDSRRKEGPWG